MKFIVCIKQVPDVASPIQLHDGEIRVETGRLMLNAYDASAVEAALVLKERVGGSVHVVLAGPPSAGETIRKALAMGADEATHLQLEGQVESYVDLDSRVYAALLAAFLTDEEFDVVACGKQAQDTDAGLTGSMLGELLELPFTGNAVDIDIDGGELVVTRQADAGQQVISMKTPCIVSCSNDMNEPRIPNLKGIMAAKRKAIAVRRVEAPAGLPRTHIRRFEPVPDPEPGRILEGNVDEVVTELVGLLKDRSKVI